MDVELFFKGLIFGLSIAAPVGPMGILCIERTLRSGMQAGLLTGIGVASADTVYGAIAAFGLASISSFLIGFNFWIQLGGGIFFAYLGLKTLMKKSSTKKATSSEATKGLFASLISAFFLTLTNPMTIMSFVAAFAGLGLTSSSKSTSLLNAWMMIAGVFLGSVFWWTILSGLTAKLRKKLTPKLFTLISRGSGIILLVFGVVSVVGSFKSLGW